MRCRSLLLLALIVAVPLPAQAYIAVTAKRLTLPEVMLEFPHIAVLKVERLDAKQGAVLLKRVETLQGEPPEKSRHILTIDGKLHPRFAALKIGDTFVTFSGSPDKRSLTLSAAGWHLTRPDHEWERFTGFRDEFPLMFGGSVDELATAVRHLVKGREIETRVAIKEGEKPADLFVRYVATDPHRRWPTLNPLLIKPRPFAEVRADLTARDPAKRQQATVELARHHNANAETPALLIAALSDTYSEVRAAGAAGLARITGGAEAVKALAKALSDEDRFVCQFAAVALIAHGQAAKTALPELAKALKDRDADHDFRPHRGAEAAEAILRIAPDSEHAPAALQLLLSNRMLNDDRIDSEGTRAAAARALGRCGKAALPALPDLLKRMKNDPLPATRIAAAEAVLNISRNADDVKAARAQREKDRPAK